MDLENAIGLLFGIVISIIGAALLFKDFGVQHYLTKWKKDIDARYVPELLRKPVTSEKEENTGSKEESHNEDDLHIVQHSAN